MIIFVGDSHGNFEAAKQAGKNATAIFLLGDQEPKSDLQNELGAEISEKTYWIFGNHDSDDPEYLRRHESMAHKNLHCKVVDIGGLRIAGFGGIFRSNILGVDHSTSLDDLPRVRPFDTRESLAAIRKDKRLAPQDHTTIFPEDITSLLRCSSEGRVDILICHEAPETHKRGYRIIGDMARSLNVRLLIHGHHHERYTAFIEGGIQVEGIESSSYTINQSDNNHCIYRITNKI